MEHIIKDNRHEYWEKDTYQKHLQEPLNTRYKPYYVCYTYPVILILG